MSYEKQIWSTGDKITAEKLNHLEDGVSSISEEIAAIPSGKDGSDGKSAYQYAQDGGYTGTEAEFAAKLAEEIPDTLPNPNALTFTGAVTGSYDGSEAVTVNIPSGGGQR